MLAAGALMISTTMSHTESYATPWMVSDGCDGTKMPARRFSRDCCARSRDRWS